MSVNATAMLPPIATPDANRRAMGPLVWIEARLNPDLRVDRLICTDRADRRSATVSLPACSSPPPVGARVVIAHAAALHGDESMLVPLLSGRIAGQMQGVGPKSERHEYRVVDDWTTLLEQPCDSVPDGSTLADVLNTLAPTLSLDTAALNAANLASLRQTLSSSSRTWGHALNDLLVEHDLCVRRDLTMHGAVVREHRLLRATSHGRPIALTLEDVADFPINLSDAISTNEPQAPIRYVAAVHGQLIESTFTLKPAWDPAQQNLDDAQYARSTSDDFDAVADVFRLWVLNEDGALDQPTFDLTGFFNEGVAIAPQPTPFGVALTRGELGYSVGVVVDRSLDSGANWSRHPGSVRNLTDRAGIYLEDDVLDAAFLAAVRSGTARLRVTATLRSPQPIESTRWMGNPFKAGGAFPTRRFELGSRFQRLRVHENSKYAEEIAAGTRQANVIDERPSLAQWLTQYTQRSAVDAGRQATMTTTRPLWSLRIGDVPANDTSDQHPMMLLRIEHDWVKDRSHLTWQCQ